MINPTHIACVLRYDPGREQAPRLLAKGRGHLARHILEAARQARVRHPDFPLMRQERR